MGFERLFVSAAEPPAPNNRDRPAARSSIPQTLRRGAPLSSPAPAVLPTGGAPVGMPGRGGEFLVSGSAVHDRRSPARWLWSHARRLGWLPAVYLLATLAANVTNSMIPGYTGRAFDRITGGQGDKLAILTEIGRASCRERV